MYSIKHRGGFLRAMILIALLWTAGWQLSAQSTAYLVPDIGAPGMNVAVELIGPATARGNFGADGLYLNNPGDRVRLICANPGDSTKIVIGPVVVSWEGRLLSTQIFVRPDVQPNSTDWRLLDSPFRVPLLVTVDGAPSNTDTLYLVRPQPAVRSSSDGELGSGGTWGIRSRRGAMIFDSLLLSGTRISVSRTDCDPQTPGIQGYLPAVILSRGPVVCAPNATVTVDASGKHGGPGGGGGGGAFCDWSGSGNDGGDGFTGGGRGGRNRAGNPVGRDEYRNPGAGTGPRIGETGSSLNGVPGGISPAYEGSGGGTGHPFGSSGTGCDDGTRCNPAGGFGGGSGQQQRMAGGGGGYATDGLSSRNGNGGGAHGSRTLVPLAGGSGGASGNPQLAFNCSGDGGGGGGALRLFAPSIEAYLLTADGGTASNGASGDGGCGSGGAVSLEAKIPSGVWKIHAQGGSNPGMAGGAGRVRMDGPLGWWSGGFLNDESLYIGPSTDTTSFVRQRFTLTGTGDGSPIQLYLKSDHMPWTLIATVTQYVRDWSMDLTLPEVEGIWFLTAVQVVQPRSPEDPFAVFSQAAANILICRAFPQLTAPAERDFGLVYCSDDMLDTVFVANTGDGRLDITSARFQGGVAGYSLQSPTAFPMSIPAGDSTAFIVRFRPGTSGTGVARDTLLLMHNDRSSPSPWQIRYQATQEIRSFTLDPRSLHYDLAYCRDTSVVDTVWVRNDGAGPVTILAPISNSSAFTLLAPPAAAFPLSLPQGAGLPLVLEFRPSAVGNFSGELIVKSDLASCNLEDRVLVEGIARAVSWDIGDSAITFPRLLCFGQIADTTVLLRNDGEVDLTLDASFLPAGAFSIVAPALPILLPAGSMTSIWLRFAPPSPGSFDADLQLISHPCSMNRKLLLTGRRDSIGLAMLELDFGTIASGGFPEQRTATIHNTGSVPVFVQSALSDPPGIFVVVSGLPTSIAAGDSALLLVQMNDPGSDGLVNGTLTFNSDPVCDPLTVTMRGGRGTAALTLEADTLSGSPGDQRTVGIYVRNASNISLAGATEIRANLRFNASLLVPEFGDGGEVVAGERSVPLRIPIHDGIDGQVLSLPFRVTLGDAENTALVFDSLAIVGGFVEITTVPGRFLLTGICREGGTRLFSGIRLKASAVPNPFNPATVIRFTLPEAGHVSLVVVDVRGRHVAELVNGPLPAGEQSVRFDGSGLPNGFYQFFLHTRWGVLAGRMLLVK